MIEKGCMETNPAKGIFSPMPAKKPPRVLTSEQVERLLEQPSYAGIKGFRDKAMLETLYATGIRVSELIALDVTDVNMSTRLITCRSGKVRDIPLYPAAIKALQTYLTYARDTMALPGENALFVNVKGGRMSRQGFWKLLKDYTENSSNQTPERRDAILFIKQKMEAAQGFIDAIRQRQEMLQRTMEVIIHIQQEFFLTGDESKLQPMILKDVAVRSGFDISTISRVSNSKYVQTNFGIYPLKFFFSESAKTESGDTVSTRKIKQIIKNEIDAENKKKPVTDDDLTAILQSKGFRIARRTVAKYREQLSIPVARLRKEI